MKTRAILIKLAVATVLLVGLVGMGPLPRAVATSPRFSQSELRPLGDVLNPDGSLNLTTGFSGTLDPSGWHMEYGSGGAPVFRPAAPSAPSNTWNALDGGLDYYVRAIAVEGPNVYVGGGFFDAGGNANADWIARWDGASWNALGSGLNGDVCAVAVEGPNVYVGGYFTDAGGNANADYVARWGTLYYRVYLPLAVRH